MNVESNPENLASTSTPPHKIDFSEVPSTRHLRYFPDPLKSKKQWVCYDSDKVPINPTTNKPASTADPATWAWFSDAVLHSPNNIGFVFKDKIVGIDLDDCRNPKTGVIEPWAQQIIDDCDSYTEVSPSGCGVHIFVGGTLKGNRHRSGRIEIYESKRYFTVTGRCIRRRGAVRKADHALAGLEERIANGETKAHDKSASEKDDSASGVDWSLIAKVQKATGATDADTLEAEVRRCHRKHFEQRDKQKGERSGLTYTRYTINNFLRQFLDDDGGPLAEIDSQPGELNIKTLERVVQKTVKWLWKDKIPYGYVTVLAGEAGVGKSTIMCSIAARLTTRWRHEVLLIADEDNDEDTLVPRLNAAGADLPKVHHMGEVAWKDEENGYAFEILRDLPKLEHWLAQHPGVKLIVIDPWINYLGNKNGYSAQEVRQVLMPLQGLAQRLGIAIVCICHFKKGSAEKANERIGGSAAIVQVPRSVLLVAEVKQENGVLYGELHQTKHNLNPRHEGKQYQIVGAVSTRNGTSITTCRVKWGSESKKDAEALFAAKDPKERSLDLCCQWLTEVLSDGELPAKQVIHSGKEKGFSERTIFRAHGVVAKSRKEPKTNRAFWYLP